MGKATVPRTKAPRGDSVVRKILLSTREELARVGYRALRIEDVAMLAGVHKTTIYRRFPEKIDLVRETLQGLFHENFKTTDTGSLRGDLIAFGQEMTAFFSSIEGQSLVRLMTTEGADPELQSIVESIRARKEAQPKQVIQAAIDRGELAPNVNGELLFQTIAGAIHHRLFKARHCVSELDLGELVDLLLYGALLRPETERPRMRRGSGTAAIARNKRSRS